MRTAISQHAEISFLRPVLSGLKPLFRFIAAAVLILNPPSVPAPDLPRPDRSSPVYYVDSRSGKDSNPGTSPEKAWKSLQKLNDTVFQPGDSILFRRNRTWNGRFVPRGSGTSNAVVTIGAYAEGKKPRINARGKEPAAIELDDLSYWTIRDLEISNDAQAPGVRSGVIIRVYNKICSGITLQDLYVRRVAGVCEWNGLDGKSAWQKWANAGILIALWQEKNPTSLNRVAIERCVVEDVRCPGILFLSKSTDKSRDVLINGNFVNRTGADGIIVQNIERPAIMSNVCYDAGKIGYEFRYIGGIWSMNCRDSLFQGNEVARTRVQKDGSSIFYGDSQAFDIDNDNTGTAVIQYNYTHDNEGGFLLVMGGSATDKVLVRYNISVNDGRVNCNDSTTLSVNKSRTFVYNNVFYSRNAGGIGIKNTPDTFYRNNIFFSDSGCVFPGLPSYDRNCYAGSAVNTADKTAVNADPRFVNPGSDADGRTNCLGYKLKDSSPCRGMAGEIPENREQDFFGNALPDGPLDIGSHQH